MSPENSITPQNETISISDLRIAGMQPVKNEPNHLVESYQVSTRIDDQDESSTPTLSNTTEDNRNQNNTTNSENSPSQSQQNENTFQAILDRVRLIASYGGSAVYLQTTLEQPNAPQTSPSDANTQNSSEDNPETQAETTLISGIHENQTYKSGTLRITDEYFTFTTPTANSTENTETEYLFPVNQSLIIHTVMKTDSGVIETIEIPVTNPTDRTESMFPPTRSQPVKGRRLIISRIIPLSNYIDYENAKANVDNPHYAKNNQAGQTNIPQSTQVQQPVITQS